MENLETKWGTVHYSKIRSHIIPNARKVSNEVMDLHCKKSNDRVN